jgi:hypothetical protein
LHVQNITKSEQNEQKAVGGETGSTFHEKAIARIKPEERALVVNSIDSRSIQQMVESYIPPINYHNRKNEPFRFTVECGFIYSSLELQSLTENFKSYGYSMGYTSLIYSVAYEESAGQYNANLHDDKTIESNKRQLNEIQLTWGHGNVESAKWSEGYSMGSRTLHVKLKGKSKAVDYQLPENLFINTGSKVDTELGDKEKKVIGEYLISHYKKMNDMDHPLTFKVRKYNFLDIN